MLSNLRSLLLAAIVLSNCITWTASRHHYSHNVAGHRSRHRRQGAGLFLSASYVIPGGEGTGWGEWGEVSPCSRTCGGGVASQKRICLQMGPDDQPACTGGDTKYFSCQTQDCPDGEDFRAQQCAEYNNVSFRGIKYKWVPYTRAPNPCELNCMPHGERFYYRQKTAVVDGTRCNDESFDVCVNGICQQVGCDMMLGSSAKEDKCRHCRGNGVNCHTLSGLLDTQELIKGYNDILLLPAGATTIIIREIRASNNYLALRASNGTYYLNGDYHIDFPRSIVIAGAIWYYERSQQGFPAPDKLRCSGPINEPLYLSLLLQEDNVGIEYEYSLPKNLAPRPTQQYNWVHEEFTPCSVSCGGGTQTRNVTCRSREELNVVDDSLCDEGLKPPTSQACSTQACAPQWVASPWGECSKKCGKGGTRSREVRCEKVITNGFPSIVADKECFDLLGAKPELYQECNVDAPCPTWFVGSWKPCDKLCDEGKQTRQVVCYQKDENDRKTILEDADCEEEKPEAEQPCILEPCDGVDWVISDWEGCDNCLSVNRTRIAECATKEHEVVDDKFCEYHPRPTLSEPCDAELLPPCEVQWYATQWSKCSVDCGDGVQTRRVFCGRFDGESVTKVEDELCKDQPKYNTTKPCVVPKEKCPSKWYAAPWSECTKECGRGEQYRRVMCLKGGKSATDCDVNLILDSTQSCNPGPCNKDEVIPVDSSLSPVMDGEEDCEEDYPEVGLDEDFGDHTDLMMSDSPTTDDGSGYGPYSFADLESTFTTDTGSGSDSTDEFIDVSLGVNNTFGEGSGETDTTVVTDSSESTTESDFIGSIEPEIKKITVSETKVTKKIESTGDGSTDLDETSETGPTLSTLSEETDSSIFTETDSTASTESTVFELVNNTSDTSETSVIISTITEETSETQATESTITVETDSTETTITLDSTESTITKEIDKTETEITSPSVSTRSTVPEETSSGGSTESIITVEPGPSPGSMHSTITENTKEISPDGLTASSLTEETSSVSTESTITEETKETSPSSSTETILTEETSPSGSTKSTLVEGTEGNSPTALTESVSTESTISEETKETVSTESTLSVETSSSISTESTITEETKETVSTESTLSVETSPSVSTDSTITEETKETASAESTLSVETSSSVSTESTITEETKETVSSISTESTLTEESSSMSTKSTFTEVSTIPEETVTQSSMEPTTAEETLFSTSTEEVTTVETTESTITDKTMSVISTEVEGTTQKSTISEETTETESGSPTVISSTEPAFEEKTTRITVPEVSSTEEESTTTSKESSSTEYEPSTVISTQPEKTTESVVTETGTTEGTETTGISTTESGEPEGSTTESVSPSDTEPSTTESESISTMTMTVISSSEGTTESTVKEESTTSESTETAASTTTGSTEESEGTTTGTTEISLSTSEEPSTKLTTIWDYHTAMGAGGKRKCKPRKTTCARSKFGCCPDRKTAAAGPFDEGCPKPRTCKESKFGCCPDGVSPAQGLDNEGCPVEPCLDTLFGCCLSDNKTAAEGNDQEGCPPPPPACKASIYGCCKDETTEATGDDGEGCPEKTTTEVGTETSSTDTELTQSSSEPSSLGTTTDVTLIIVESCFDTEFGCCSDNETIAEGPNEQGCPCNVTVFGCCHDGINTALGVNYVGCPAACKSSRHGCCSDNETPAHGPNQEGCCLLTAYGCCPDNRKPADGPHLEGCGCQYAEYGCCPDNVTSAHGPNKKGCGCQYTEHGCCPDRHTEATGPNFEGCLCNTYQFGCCPDGVTVAKSPAKQGCSCEQTTFGCCGDGQTAATGPDQQGCDCASSKYGCCPDGVTSATGDKFLGCTDAPKNKQAACSLPTDRGSCTDYSVQWFYDVEYGGCSRFWYGGCEGNGNRFSTKEECEGVCVEPSPKDACKLPKSKGACLGYHVMWHYDSDSEQCRQFVYGGCLGNANKFETRQQCQTQCEPARTADQCTLPIERGSCAGNFARWGYNPETHKCEEFIWGGCEGNPNRFGTEAACIQRCDVPGVPKPQCELPQVVGNCTDKQALWSFSQTENRCVPFYYSGCSGNENRFNSEESCTEACPSAYVPDLCTMPAETGECANYRERWYFDTTQQRCRQFYYGGCGGNTNNFQTREECEGRCSEQVTTTPSTTVHVPEPQNLSEYCFMEIDTGPCTQLETRWAYDYTMGRCITFQYGGCGGNRNNFPTVDHCTYYCKPTQDLCQLPMFSGPCDQSIMRWFYDPSSDSCSQFTYGGCEGNDNRFDTREDCERRCRTGPAAPVPEPTTTVASVDSRLGEDSLPLECAITPTLEQCIRAGEVWYMDTQRRECVPFENVESGVECMNTGVFASQESCERSCGVFRNIDVCRYDVDPGPCQNYQAKYYFNATAGRCLEYAYGGCHGGPNRFSTIDECMDICRPAIDPCKLGPEPGNCLARFTQWYYIPDRDECNQFIWTGCGGNDNRFETREDCEGRCRRGPVVATTTTTTTTTTGRPITTHKPVSEECHTPPSLEPCGAPITAYYYNSETGTCEIGAIGGCGYQNSYRSEEECERRCGAFKDIDVCRAFLDPGSCRMSIPKFYWEAASGSCQPYTYSGCGGGPNRFSTAEECQELCGPTGPAARCLEESGVVGTTGCGPPSRRWYYSVSRADCIVFIYQGCGGNGNSFTSYDECAFLCKVSQLTGPNEVLPDCSEHIEGCSRAASECPFGVEKRVEGGCERCSCKPIACDRYEQECDALVCGFGVYKVAGVDGCPRCSCHEDPCKTANCSSTETCRVEAYRDPTTQEATYAARCEPEVTNEILPECDRYNEECLSLRCQFGVQRTRTASGCERCSCVPVEVDCTSFREECENLLCSYGIDWSKDDNGCPRCTCTDPCEKKACATGERCVIITYRDPISTQIKNSTECRKVNKAGLCPAEEPRPSENDCRVECNDDADCRGVAKCCQRGCFSLCLPPVTETTTVTTTTTTIAPELPHPPAANTELTEPQVTASEGGKATLRCLFHGNPPPKITWRRNEITIDGDVGRYRLLSDGALEIVSLYRNDSGVYICIADNGLGTATQEIRLQVSDPVKAPAGIAGDENAVITGDLGKPLIVRCLTYGYPKPTVYWYRGINGPMVPFSSAQYEARFDVLKIRRLTYDTLGEYLCQAYNGEGKAATWLVVVRAYQPEGSREDNKYLVTRGDKIVDLTSREPRTETSTTTTTPAPLPEPQPEPEFDYDIPVYTVPVSTNISNTAINLTTGRELTVTCDVNGYPEPDVFWSKDSVRLVHSDRIWISGTSISRLTIPHVATSDSGVYACHAVNAYGSHYSTVHVTVQAPSIPAKCVDNPYFANCTLIVRNRFCNHIYYSRFCCKSCMEAGQLSPEQAEMQSDQPYAKRK